MSAGVVVHDARPVLVMGDDLHEVQADGSVVVGRALMTYPRPLSDEVLQQLARDRLPAPTFQFVVERVRRAPVGAVRTAGGFVLGDALVLLVALMAGVLLLAGVV